MFWLTVLIIHDNLYQFIKLISRLKRNSLYCNTVDIGRVWYFLTRVSKHYRKYKTTYSNTNGNRKNFKNEIPKKLEWWTFRQKIKIKWIKYNITFFVIIQYKLVIHANEIMEMATMCLSIGHYCTFQFLQRAVNMSVSTLPTPIRETCYHYT